MTITCRRESDDAYSGVVARLNARWRAIVCRDAIQWIVQKAKSRARARWASVWYFRIREALVGFLPRSILEIDPVAMATLKALPARIGEARS